MAPIHPNIDNTAAYYVYLFLGLIADAISWLTPRTKRPASDFVKESEVDSMSDDEILTILKSRQFGTLSVEAGVELGDNNIQQLSESTLVKRYDAQRYLIQAEALAYDLVFHHTTIPVPRVRRVIQCDTDTEGYTIFAMDRIRGRQLAQVWSSMSIIAKIRVAFTLRGYIKQLRAIKHPRSVIPGAMAPDYETMECECPLFGEIGPPRGPFSSYTEFSAFWNYKYAQVSKDVLRRTGRALPSKPFDDSSPLVLTHGDLNMRNVLLGDDGRLWLIDWAWSGFYPQWFEYVIARRQSELTPFHKHDRAWDLLMPLICGPYFGHWRWYYSIAYVFDCTF